MVEEGNDEKENDDQGTNIGNEENIKDDKTRIISDMSTQRGLDLGEKMEKIQERELEEKWEDGRKKRRGGDVNGGERGKRQKRVGRDERHRGV